MVVAAGQVATAAPCTVSIVDDDHFLGFGHNTATTAVSMSEQVVMLLLLARPGPAHNNVGLAVARVDVDPGGVGRGLAAVVRHRLARQGVTQLRVARWRSTPSYESNR